MESLDDLKISTITDVVYSNMTFDLKAIFDNLPVVDVDPTFITFKKRKVPIIKSVYAPYGSIISIRYYYKKQMDYRGLCTKPDEVLLSQLRSKVNSNDDLSVDEMDNLTRIEGKKKTRDFVNQVCIIVSLSQSPDDIKNINVMLFNSTIKSVGGKNTEDVKNVIKILWKHMHSLPASYTLNEGCIVPSFEFFNAMTNYNMFFNLTINREVLQSILMKPEYKDIVKYTYCNLEGSFNIRCSLLKVYPERDKRIIFKFKDGINYDVIQSDSSVLSTKEPKDKYISFSIFQSSKATLSGRDKKNMEYAFSRINEIITKHKDEISL